MKLPARAWRVGWDAVRLFVEDQGLSWAGAIGLYLFLSVPPLMVAVAWAGRLFAPPGEAESFIVEQVSKYLPARPELFAGVVEEGPPNAAAGAASVALLLFSGSRGFAALTSAVNVMWRRVDRLTFVRRQLLRLGMLLVSLALLGVSALGEALVARLAFNGAASSDLWLLDWQLIPTLLLGTLVFAAYKLLPREPVDVRHAAFGAVLATAGLRLAQASLGTLSEAGIFRTPYGELADVALMATWGLVVGVVVLFGAAVVAVLDGKHSVKDGRSEDRFLRSG